MTSFDKLLEDLDHEYANQQHQKLGVQEDERTKPAYHQVCKAQQNQQRVRRFGGELIQWLADSVGGLNVVMSRTPKPRWAVVAAVIGRDMGKCRVCLKPVGGMGTKNDWTVKQRIRPKDGGQFEEPNCVLVCEECSKVWPRGRNFYFYPTLEEGWLVQRAAVLKARIAGRKGVKPLDWRDEVVMQNARLVLERVRELKSKRKLGI